MSKKRKKKTTVLNRCLCNGLASQTVSKDWTRCLCGSCLKGVIIYSGVGDKKFYGEIIIDIWNKLNPIKRRSKSKKGDGKK